MAYYEWRPYVSVAKRRAKAEREMKKLRKKGRMIEPVAVEGRKIARTFWGEAWCKHLEQFSDYANRLPRGRTYVRNGSVCHLAITKGEIEAIVSGSELYHINIRITPLSANKWKKIRKQCAGQIGSMLELLQGRLSNHVMQIVSDRNQGLFPNPSEIKLSCDCPDWAEMCKHVAAVLYGIGARLDHQPELLFLLRNVDHEELITAELELQTATSGKGKRRRLARQDLSEVFGVEIEEPPEPGRGSKKRSAAKKVAKKRIAAKTKKKHTTRAVKKAAARSRKSALTKSATVVSKKTFIPTAAAVVRLRKRFGMNQSQFAKLLNISQPTVANWEHAEGKLKLRQRTLEALIRASKLTADQAMKKIKHI
ncbi:MAG: helix-turn-helix domain-containing protein [Pseudomonadota bacterium]